MCPMIYMAYLSIISVHLSVSPDTHTHATPRRCVRVAIACKMDGYVGRNDRRVVVACVTLHILNGCPGREASLRRSLAYISCA